jgi:hypothetical protein
MSSSVKVMLTGASVTIAAVMSLPCAASADSKWDAWYQKYVQETRNRQECSDSIKDERDVDVVAACGRFIQDRLAIVGKIKQNTAPGRHVYGSADMKHEKNLIEQNYLEISEMMVFMAHSTSNLGYKTQARRDAYRGLDLLQQVHRSDLPTSMKQLYDSVQESLNRQKDAD